MTSYLIRCALAIAVIVCAQAADGRADAVRLPRGAPAFELRVRSPHIVREPADDGCAGLPEVGQPSPACGGVDDQPLQAAGTISTGGRR
jgi:hypothetical protein